MMHTRRAFLSQTAAMTSGLWLAGCGGADPQAATPSLSSSAVAVPAPLSTPTPTPTDSATPIPTPTPTPTATTTALAGLIVEAGDSIGAGYLDDGYAAIDHLGFGDGVTVVNLSVTGRTMTTGFQLFVDIARAYDPSRPCVLLIQQGTNDLAGGTSGEALYQLATRFVAMGQAAGFYVALDTILPRADAGWSSAKEAQRQRYNLLVRANAAVADVINDITADPQIGDANPNWQSYYPDALHPSVAGQQRLAVITALALRPLLLRSPRAPGSTAREA